MKATVQWVFVLGYGFYDQMHRVPQHIRNAADRIMQCRKALLGGHIQGCPDGHYQASTTTRVNTACVRYALLAKLSVGWLSIKAVCWKPVIFTLSLRSLISCMCFGD
jgi:hypothetical protein